MKYTAVSAFEAARRAREPESIPKNDLAASLAEAPYDGHLETGSNAEDVDEVVPSVATESNLPLSTWRPKGKNVLRDDDEVWEISMKPDETVTVIGEFDVTVLSGVVSVYGAMLHPNSVSQRVYALSTAALPVIMAKKATSLRIKSVTRSIESLGKYSPLFRNISVQDEKGRSFKYLASPRDDPLRRSLSSLEISDDTKRVISRINARLEANERPRILAVGAKSSGKSTFSRILCNVLVTRPGGQKVAYLDIDPGQPEFGTPGQLSVVEVGSPILGPPFCHPATTRSLSYRLIRSHNIAATSFKDEPDHFIICVMDLLRHVPKSLPLITNPCGWVSGTGASVLLQLIGQLRITDVVVLHPVETQLQNDIEAAKLNVHAVAKRPGGSSTKTPAELRSMQTMSYFHQKQKTATASDLVWLDKSISKMRPWMVSYDRIDSGIAAILSYNHAPHPEFLAEVLNGMVVAVTVPDDGLIDPDIVRRTPQESLPYMVSDLHGCSSPVDPRESNCIGVALIRGIDTENKRLLLLTPLHDAEIASLMQRQIVLVRGSFDCPEWAFLEDQYCATKAAARAVDTERNAGNMDEQPWVTLQEPVGIEGSIWRLRHPPTAADVMKSMT
ncbi:Polynucleotide 5 -hydroxyl-kinase grc3 [Lecanosticta acicola]|uniref:Polynucleotide 5'-hydroxyl-kinase GRC3 n=1 Tax=Lecanosticta acicola TaxID=111012 RepID=A0AAI8YWT2_9PEZI|nr:Polynucleotide 5 -hydroxyl-kinase grc3 [Lecanosticta acicola]